MKRHTKPRPQSYQDKLQAEAVSAAADGAIEQLKRCVARNPDRRIRELSRKELEMVCIGAIAAWTRKRSEQSESAPTRADALETWLAELRDVELDELMG